MKKLLNDRFAPVTHNWGFLRASLEELIGAYTDWLNGRHWLTPAPQWACDQFESDLARALLQLEPLNQSVSLLVETPSPWTAVFVGHFSGPQSDIPYLSKALPCRGLLVGCVEHTYDPDTNKGIYGGVDFTTFAADPTMKLNDERTIQVMVNDDDHWEFHESGPTLPFEKPEWYKARRIRDRFTPEMLEAYCLALGIRLFDEDFYGPRCALFRETHLMPGVELETYDIIKKRLLL